MSPRPPRSPRALIRFLARPEDRPAVLHDLAEEFRTMQTEGADLKAARRWYWRQALGSAIPLLRTRFSGIFGGGTGPLTSLLDIRLGLRMLVKHPGLTMVAIFALAVGIPIGLAPLHSAAVFETPLPVPEAERVVIVRDYDVSTHRYLRSPVEDWVAWNNGLRSFGQMGAFIVTDLNVGLNDNRDPAVEGAFLTASSFGILRENAALGRVLVEADAQPGGPDVVVVGHAFWQNRLGGDPAVVGTTLRVAGVPHTVVGVMPDEFQFPKRTNIWLPLRVEEPVAEDERRVVVFGRLADGVSAETAQIEVESLGVRMVTAEPLRRERLQAIVSPFSIGLFGLSNDGLDGELGFYFVQLLALFVLVVACLNIGMLILVRTTSRAGELAVRTALGASRARVVTQLFVEALLLGVIAAGIGLFIADRAADRLTFLSEALPYWMDLGVSLRTTIWALSLAAFSAAVVGVIPALKVTGQQVQQNMQQARASKSGVRFGGVSSALIMADVALAVVAVGIAFAFSDAFTVVSGDGGTVRSEEYLYAQLGMGYGSASASRTSNTELAARSGDATLRVLERLRSEPGVRAVALATGLPGTEQEYYGVEIEGDPLVDGQEGTWTSLNSVSPGFFEAMDQPVLAGRPFQSGDVSPESPFGIVNSEFVDEALGGRSPLGRRIRPLKRDGTPAGPWIEVVGVVAYVATSNSLIKGEPGIYVAAAPEAVSPARFAIRLGEDPASFIPRLRAIAQEVDAEAIIRGAMPLNEVKSFDEIVMQWMKLGVKVLIGILIALAASGTYALMSFTVAARTHEIAIRGALGAPRGQILLTIARRAMMQLSGGVILGMLMVGPILFLAASGGWTPTLSPLVLTLMAGLGVMAAIGLLAFAGPTRQGLGIAPSEALKG